MHKNDNNLKIHKEKIYQPSDDSYLLSGTLKKYIPKIDNYRNKKYLGVGCGSGIQLETLHKIGISRENIFSLDINPQAVKKCRSWGFNSVVSDLFSNISKKEKYNIMIFNPPYLPERRGKEYESRISKTMTTGGDGGGEIINKFFEQSKKHLEENGIIFLIASSLTKNIKWNKLNKFDKKKINQKNLFFEKLYVWKLESVK